MEGQKNFGLPLDALASSEWDEGVKKTAPHLNRKPGVFAVAVGEFYSFRSDWHQDDRADPLVRQYQLTLSTILRDRPDLASCAVHCCHCEIRFLTHPRNANRRDLRCAFGCREHHRRHQANERSKRHYQTAHGRKHKKLLNGKRSVTGRGGEGDVLPSSVPTGEDVPSSDTSSSLASRCTQDPTHRLTQIAHDQAPSENVELTLDGFVLNEFALVNSSMLPYLAMVASLIEGCAIGRCRQISFRAASK